MFESLDGAQETRLSLLRSHLFPANTLNRAASRQDEPSRWQSREFASAYRPILQYRPVAGANGYPDYAAAFRFRNMAHQPAPGRKNTHQKKDPAWRQKRQKECC